MNNEKIENLDANVPEGAGFFHAVMQFAATCEQLTDTCLASESPAGPISTHVHLGTLLSLLDRVSSCWWGCRQGDHTAEQHQRDGAQPRGDRQRAARACAAGANDISVAFDQRAAVRTGEMGPRSESHR